MVDSSAPTPIPMNSGTELESPEEIIQWAYNQYRSRLVVTSSFQTHSIPLLHMVSLHAPDIEVVFLDTGFHFAETIRFRDHVVNLLRLRLRILSCDIGHAAFLRQFGALYAKDPDRCCYINKVEPWGRLFQDVDAWITGIRRDQSETRTQVPLTFSREDGKVKIAPLARVTRQEIDAYRKKFRLPEHPLTRKGYKSIACFPCTRKTPVGQDERAGRWTGTSKTECGLHEDCSARRKTS